MKKARLSLLLICISCSASNKPASNNSANVPVCIEQLIKKFEAAEKQNPPRSILSYRYKEQTVYYVTAVCCDQFSDLYDSNCNLIGHPDGGFTGKGDRKYTDFDKLKTAEKLVWKDSR